MTDLENSGSCVCTKESEVPKSTYEFKISILKNELISIYVGSASKSSRWVNIGLITVFGSLLILGAYGENIVNFFRMISN
jgi:hypothetical protein